MLYNIQDGKINWRVAVGGLAFFLVFLLFSIGQKNRLRFLGYG